jgi:hypothetical protein
LAAAGGGRPEAGNDWKCGGWPAVAFRLWRMPIVARKSAGTFDAKQIGDDDESRSMFVLVRFGIASL